MSALEDSKRFEQLLTAVPIEELPSKARIKWPKQTKRKLPLFRRRRTTMLIREQEHVKIALEAGLDLKKCAICGILKTYGRHDVHHINRKNWDNAPENLQVLCRFCHINITHGYPTVYAQSELEGVIEDE